MVFAHITCRLSGTVRHIGLPVAGVLVSLLLIDSQTNAEKVLSLEATSSRGEFNFAVEPGIYALKVVPDPSTRFLPQTVEYIEVNTNTQCSVVLETGYILKGKIIGIDDAVLSKYRVRAVRTAPPYFDAYSRIDLKGNYSLVLPRGKYQVVSYCQTGGDLRAATHVATMRALVELGGDKAYDFTFPSLKQLKGQVVESNGTAVAYARITILQSLHDVEDEVLALSGAECVSNEQGFFEAYLQPGIYDLLIEPTLDDKLSPVIQEIKIESDCAETFKFSEGLLVEGEVRFSKEPVKYCRVVAFPEGQTKGVVTRSNEKGSFSFRLPKGQYKLCIEGTSDNNGNGTFACWAKTIKIDCQTKIPIELKKGYKVSFEVFGEDNQPLRACKILCSRYGDPLGKGKSTSNQLPAPQETVITSVHGIGELIVAQGVYSFEFIPPADSPYQTKTIRQLSIGSDTERKVKLPFASKDSNLQSTVTQLWIQGTQDIG